MVAKGATDVGVQLFQKCHRKIESSLSRFVESISELFPVIIIVILFAVVGVGLTAWSKMNNKWCFAIPEPKGGTYKEAPTTADDPPIIKNSSKNGPSKEEKTKPTIDENNPV